MNYQTMQHQARDKHQRLRQEAQTHRLARQAKSTQAAPGQPNLTLKLAGALAGVVTFVWAVIILIQ
jgi:CHASE3 domain sensor protein